ncbi:MAG: helix-turn-helix domain-containing protein [Lactobacillus sp.]|nr:helix-turn-helix domain-containing protein [Lactobacillus sp.]
MINLKEVRIQYGYSKHQLAQYLDIKESDIDDWEKGKTPLNATQVYALAYILNVDADLLII